MSYFIKSGFFVFLVCYSTIGQAQEQTPGDADPPRLTWPPLDEQWVAKTTRRLSESKLPSDVATVPLSIVGSVVSTGRRVITGAVTLVINDTSPIGAEHSKPELVAIAISDSNGRFSINRKIASASGPIQNITLLTMAKGYGFSITNLMHSVHRGLFQITLVPESEIEVRTATVDSMKVGGAQLRVTGLECMSHGGRRRFKSFVLDMPFETTLTGNPDGVMRVGNVPPNGVVRFRLSHGDYMNVTCSAVARLQRNRDASVHSPTLSQADAWPPPLSSPLEVQFPPVDRGWLQVVDDQTGEPISGAKIDCTTMLDREPTTDKQGKCRFAMLTSKRTNGTRDSVMIIPPSELHPAMQLKVDLRREVSTVVRLPRAVKLSGVVHGQRNDHPIPHAFVFWADNVANPINSVAAQADGNGSFEILVPSGKGKLVAKYNDGSFGNSKYSAAILSIDSIRGVQSFPISINTADLNPAAPIKLKATLPHVRTVIVMDEVGTLIPNATVHVIGSMLANTAKKLRTGRDGSVKFRLKDEETEFALIAKHLDAGSVVSSADVSPSGSIRMQLRPMATVVGRVLLEGKAARNVKVQLRPQDGLWSNPIFQEEYFVGRTDAEGTFRVKVVANVETKFVIALRVPDARPAVVPTVNVKPEAQILADVVKLFRTAGDRVINGSVVDATGNPAKVRVAAYRDPPRAPTNVGRLYCSTVDCDEKGHFKLPYLPNTKLYLTIGEGTASKVIEVDKDKSFVQVKLGS